MDIIDLLIGVVASPQTTIKEISQKKPVSWAILISLIIIIVLFNSLISVYTTPETYQGFPPIIIVGASILSTFIFLFAAPLLYLLIAKLFDGKWDYWGLLSAIGFADVVNVFIVFFALLTVLLETQAFLYLFAFISFVWTSVLYVFAIRENAGISTGQSVATYILSFIAFIVGAIAIIAIPLILIFLLL